MNNEGIRIQKVLSDNGVLSRRKAEDAIRQKRVQVNGRPCVLGQKINPRNDIIALDGVNIVLQRRKQNVYIMLHKPRGYVTTTSDEMGRRCVADLMEDAPAKVYPVGRLDKQSEGLLLLTNDGDFANQIMHPRSHVSKTYRVTVRSAVEEQKLVKLATGVELDGKPTLPASVHMISSEPGRSVLHLTIFEGRNRQVRRMCEAVGLEVARLKRVSIGPLKLGMLKAGAWRELTPAELLSLRASVKKSENRSRQEAGEAAARERAEKGKGRGGKQQGRDTRSGRDGKPGHGGQEGRSTRKGRDSRPGKPKGGR